MPSKKLLFNKLVTNALKKIQPKKIQLFILVVTLITLTSALPVNQFIQNENNIISNQINDSNNSKNLVTQNSKLTSIVNPKSSYSYNDTFSVTGVVNGTYYMENILGYSYNYLWYLPAQQVDVYIGVNPCVTRDAQNNCVPSALNGHPLSDYKLQVSNGKSHSGGVDANGDGFDDNLGVYTSSSSETYATYYNTLSYNFSVQLPSQSYLSYLGLTAGSISIYEYHPSNSTLSTKGWVTSNESIILSSDANVNLVPNLPFYTVTALNATVNVDFQAYLLTPATPLINVQIDYNISDSNNNLKCGTSGPTCSSAGFSVTEDATGLTNSTGWIHFVAGFSAVNSVPEGLYKFSAIAVLINPTTLNANSTLATTYSLTKNKMTTVNFTVNYNLQTPVLSKENVTNPNNLITNIFPFNNSPANPSLRPGSYFEGYIRHTVYSGTMGVSGASLTPKLYSSTGVDLTSQLTGGFASLSYIGSSTSNSNGYVEFNFSLSYSAPLDTYNLTFVGDYTGLTNMTPTWIKSLTSSNSLTYTFTVANLFDNGSISYIKAFPSSNTTLTTSPTDLTIEFQATASLNQIYYTYAQYYPTTYIPNSPYPLYRLVVNATLANYSSSVNGITLSVGAGFSSYNSTFYYTDANGYINFTLSTKYPDTYNLTTFQLDIIADYTPMIANNASFYRFTRPSTYTTNTTTGSSLPVSFNPNYTVVDLISYNYFGGTNNNVTTGYLEPGQTGLFVYQTVNTTTGGVVSYVPFNFSIVLGSNTPGLFIYTNNTAYPGYNGYNESNINGLIFIFFSSTYGITPEITTPIPISISVYLNITLFNLTKTDSNFYIGQYHKGFSTYSNFQYTWSEISQGGFSIQTVYTFAKPVWIDPVTDQQILNPTAGLNLVRPNNETITIRLKIVDNVTNSILLGYGFAVNVSFLSSYQGVSLAIAPSFTALNSSWFFTNSSGYIDFLLKINYLTGYSKTGVIRLNATVDFSQTQCINYCGTHSERWIVGEYPVANYNMSQDSISTITSQNLILNITKSPAYVYGSLMADSVTPNNIQPGNYVNVTYLAYISKNSVNANLDNLLGGNNLPLQGITVYVNETYLSLNGMNITLNGLATDSTGKVTFTIGITSSTSNGLYNIPAYADYENDQALSISVANKTGTFNYFWLNGTISNAGYYNQTGGLQVQNYSPATSLTLNVQRAQTTITTINRIFNSSNKLVSTNPTTTEVLRGYTLELSIIYKDQYNTPLSNKLLTVNVTTSAKTFGYIYDYPTTTTTDINGQALVNITVKNTYLVGNAMVSAYEQGYSGPFQANSANFAIKANLSLSNVNYSIKGNSNEAISGETITVTGNIIDEFGQMGYNYYNSSILGELSNSLKISGYNGTNLITGTTFTTGFTFSNTGGSFSYIWQVPQSYTYKDLNITLQLYQTGNIVHFINSTNYLSLPLPQYTQKVDIFQNVNYKFSFSNTNANNVSYNGQIISINSGYTGPLTFSGYLFDNYGRAIFNRSIFFSYNASQVFSTQTDFSGQFLYAGFIPEGASNVTYAFTLYYKNASNLPINVWTDNIVRTVTDVFAPTIVELPTSYNNTYIYQSLTLAFNVTDPVRIGNLLVPSVGLNTTSIVLEMNGTIIWNNIGNVNWNGIGLINISWNYASINPADQSVNLTLIAFDNANNKATYVIMLYLDHQAPTIIATNPSTNVYAYESNYVFTLKATDNGQTGINPNAVFVFVNGTQYSLAYNAISGLYQSIPISFHGLKGDTSVYFNVTDMAGNTQTSSLFTLLADNIKPTIILSNPTINNFNQYKQVVTFTFQVSDAQSGINLSSLFMYDSLNNIVGSNNTFVITNGTGYYIVTGQLTKNQLNLQTSNQQFLFVVEDNNGNQQTFTLSFNIDTIGPTVTGITVYQTEVNSSSIVNIANTNLTASMQYVQFNLSDSGTPTTGIDKSYFQVRLVVNTTFTLILTYQNGVFTASNSSFNSYFTYVPSDNSSIIVGWNATDIGSFGITKTYNPQNITVQWELLSLKDNYGNTITSSSSNIIEYGMKIDALPPPPNYLGLLLNFGAVFLIFIGIGVAIAYIYEKIRYVG